MEGRGKKGKNAGESKEMIKDALKKKDSISAFFWLSLSGLILKEGSQIPFGTLSHPKPGFFPFIIGIILGILSMVLLGRSLLKGEAQEVKFLTSRGGWGRVGLALGSLLVYYLILESIGFLIASFFLVFVLIKFMEPQKWIYSASVSAAISLGAYLLFQLILKANLPLGITKRFGF
jgi:putative tricarboxylic transport membrane protein